MSKKFWFLSLLAVIASFFGGFFMANAFNRTELSSLRTENDRLKASSPESADSTSESSIGDNELTQKISEADQHPDNFEYQKNLGLALYKYASMKHDTSLLKQSARILERAAGLRSNDLDVVIGLGNAHFDLGYFGKDNAELVQSRNYYTRALSLRANDVEVTTDLGLSYFLVDPPEDQKAIAEFQKSLKIDPKHEKTLEFMVQSLIRLNRLDDAENYLAQLRVADPSSDAINGLAAKIEQTRSLSAK
ncbi:MAG: tetratricopeptide repeat protein [Pyrinomonadaceae bacterium]